MTTLRLGFLASHGGSNVQAIIDACKAGRLQAEPKVVISNNSMSRVLERARQEGVAGCHLSRRTHPDAGELDRAIVAVLERHAVQVVCLAGYMRLLGPATQAAYGGRILNIHPALLPKFGGQGFYAEAVHAAVLKSGDRESGATVHLVTEEYDQGRILTQTRVPVLPEDTVQSLAARVLVEEHRLYADTLQNIAAGRIQLEGLQLA